jgi:hypothetical protein
MAARSSSKRTYRVIFTNQGQVYEVYARRVSQADLHGFVEVEEIVFGQRSSLVVDPSEERLKTEFQGVNRFFLPIYAISRIDEVEKEGPGRIRARSEADGNVALFPAQPLGPTKGGDRKQ